MHTFRESSNDEKQFKVKTGIRVYSSVQEKSAKSQKEVNPMEEYFARKKTGIPVINKLIYSANSP